MQKSFLRQNVLPVLAAMIRGTAFVAQSVCAPYVPPFAFNAIRALIAFVLLIFVSLAFDKAAERRGRKPEPTDWKSLLLGGLCTGAFLAIASNLQQAGLADTSAGKAGFITALYVVLVPVLGIFFRKKCGKTIWISIALALSGLYLMCIGGSFSVRPSDVFVMVCGLFFALQIRVIDTFSVKCNCVKLSCVQFLVCGTLSLAATLLFERVSPAELADNAWPIIYLGIFSSGIAYTLQMVAQKGNNPAVVSVLLSMESVFSALSGAVLLHEKMLPREYIGCVLMFSAVLTTQFVTEDNLKKWKEKRNCHVQKRLQ